MKKLLICSMLVGALAACGDDDGRDGPITLMDSGTSPGTDAGTTPTMDGGSTMTEDAGGSTMMCAEPLPALPAMILPRCSADTLSCLMGCGTDQMCQQTCIDNDMTAPFMQDGVEIDCASCLSFQAIHCGGTMGCGSEWADWNCCLEGCSGTTEECQTMCQTQANAFIGCVNGLGAACGSLQQQCFPAG